MAQQLTLSGQNIKVYINNVLYAPVQSLQFTVNYNEVGIFGIDVPFAQEVAGNKCDVTGSISGLRTIQSSGLQGAWNGRPAFTELGASPYISIRINDRVSGEDILLLQNAKITSETHSVNPKGIYSLNFSFVGQIPLFAGDRIS